MHPRGLVTGPTVTPAGPRGDSRIHVLGWGIGLCVAIVVGALLPWVNNPDFYYYADTPEGAFGQWFELGQSLRRGRLPLLNPAAWMAGNYIAEGQWGLFNPFVLAMSWLVSGSTDAVVASSVAKVVGLVIGGLGTFALTLHLGGRAPWASLAGFSAAFAGFTLFMDATSWVTNLWVWAFFTWTVTAISAHARGRIGVWAPAVAAHLLITVGYLQGTLMLILFYACALLDHGVRRQWSAFGRTFLSGVASGLVAFAVFLPGLLTSSVTTRASGIENDGFMVLTLTALASSISPASAGPLNGWWGDFTEVPLTYIAWFLPLLVLVGRRERRTAWPVVSTLALFTLGATLFAIGPSQMGPLRFPARTVPWVATGTVVLSCVLLSHRAARGQRSARQVVFVAGLALIGAWITFATTPNQPLRIGAFTLVALAGLLAGWWLLGDRRAPLRVLVAPLVLCAVTVTVLGMQSRVFAPQIRSRSDYPAAISAYQQAMPGARGDAIVVGNALGLGDDLAANTVFGNLWYLSDDVSVQNLYTPVGYATYSADLCLRYDGRTCPQLVTTLFSEDPTTGVPLADLLSLDAVQILADDQISSEDFAGLQPPPGWRESSRASRSVTWQRVDPTGAAGGVTWTSPGVDVVAETTSALEVTLRVRAPAGGTVVFSRLDWPGYRVSGATLAAPLRGYLVTLDVPPDAAEREITLTWRPPGWTATLAAWAGFGVVTIAGTLWPHVRRRGLRRPSTAPAASHLS